MKNQQDATEFAQCLLERLTTIGEHVDDIILIDELLSLLIDVETSCRRCETQIDVIKNQKTTVCVTCVYIKFRRPRCTICNVSISTIFNNLSEHDMIW